MKYCSLCCGEYMKKDQSETGRACPDCGVKFPTVTDVFLHGLSVHRETFDRLFKASARVNLTE